MLLLSHEQHVFFYYHHAKFLWRAVHIAFMGLQINHKMCLIYLLLDLEEQEITGSKLETKLLVGASALCRAIWLSRSYIIF